MGDPDFLYAAPPVFACAAFCKESRMKFLDSTKLHRKPGGSPTIVLRWRRRTACGFLTRNKFSIKPRLVVWHGRKHDEKDGAPWDLLQFLPRTRNAPFHIPRVGNIGGRLKRKPHTRSCLGLRNRKSGYAGANVGHPSGFAGLKRFRNYCGLI